MQNGIQVFSNHLFGEVRVANENGKGFLAGSDVARALGYARPADAITAHCKGVVVLPTPTKNQYGKGQIYFVNKLLVENANNKVKQNQ